MADINKPPRASPRTARASTAVTAHDVAQVAGVSAITVSRVLNVPHQVAAETLLRVQAAIAQTGYVPNLLAKSLNANTSTRLVAAVVPTISGPIFAASMQALTKALAAERYQLMLGQTFYEAGREDDLLDAIIGRRPDGIVLTGVMHSVLGRRRLQAAGIPVVETWDLTDDPIDMVVGFSHEKVGAAVCEFLHQKGRRRFAVIAARDVRAERRTAAFQTHARSLGLPEVPVVFADAPGTLAGGRACFSTLMTLHPDTDAVFCSSDMLALGAITEAQALGVSIPGRIAMVGFGDLDFAQSLHPALSSVRVDGDAIGGQAARFIIDAAQGKSIAERVVDVGFSVVDRDSSAC